MRKNQRGFFSVELLVVLFIAAAFVVSGYQLYSSVITSSANGKSDIAASNLANDYLERYRYRSSTPCNEKTVIEDMSIQSDILRDPRVTVKISCPIQPVAGTVQPVTNFLRHGVSSKVEVTVTYDGGRKTSTSKIVNHKVTIKQIASRYEFTVALGTDGQVYSWGRNAYGQLGNGTITDMLRPVQISSASGPMAGKRIKKIAVGGFHVLALSEEGEVYTWGYNASGQLGDGTTQNKSVPVELVKNGSSLAGISVEDIAASYTSSAAIGSDGKVYTWGSNTYGELGNETTDAFSTKPVLVKNTGTSPLTNKKIRAISAGYYYFVVIGNNVSDVNDIGDVYAWGSNSNGQLGTNISSTTLSYSRVPVVVYKTSTSSLTGKLVKEIAAGGFHAMALATDGTIHAWGAGGSGQLGQNNTTSYSYPRRVLTAEGSSLNGRTVAGIGSGAEASYAVDSTGAIHAWGYNGYGQLGNGATTNAWLPVLTKVEGTPLIGRTITQISGGGHHVMAIDNEGSVYTWGYNNRGQLGNGTLENSYLAQLVQNGAVISKLTSGFNYSIVLMSDNTLYGWGRGTNYALGNNSTTQRPWPALVTGTALEGKNLIDLVTGGYHSFVRDSDGKLYMWGANSNGQLGNGTTTNVSIPTSFSESGTSLEGKTITKMVASELNTMALTSDGKVHVWGANTYGQVGNGTTTTPVTTPFEVTGGALAGKTIKDIALGRYSAYAIDSAGVVYAWGRGTSYALGNASTATQTTPVDISTGYAMAGKNIVEIAAGASFAVARAATGEVYGWGLNTSGQLGDGTASSKTRPTLQPAGISYEKMSAGDLFMAALGSDGYLYTWGSNAYYQQANGTTTNVTAPTAQAPFSARAIDQVTTGAYSVLVLDYGKNTYGWGYNNYGDLGVANTDTPQQTPRPLTRIQYDNAW